MLNSILKYIADAIKSIFSAKPAEILPIQSNPIQQVPDVGIVAPEPLSPKPEVKMMDLVDAIKLCVKKYEGVRETNGKNRSPVIDKIITSHGGGLGSAYCAYGACQIVDDLVALYASKGHKVSFDIYKTGSSQTMWAKAKDAYKLGKPKAGSIVIWKHMNGNWTGHVGICLSDLEGGGFKTFEFNTSPDNHSVVRDGEGAYYKTRPFKDVGDMHILGFIDLQKAMKVL